MACKATGAALRRQTPRTELAGDEGLDSFVGAVGLWAWVGDPAVLAALKDLQFAFSTGRAVSGGKFLLNSRQDIVVQFALQDVKRRQGHRLAAFEDELWIAFVDGFPGVEINFAVLDHFRPLSALRLLVAREWIAYRRARHDVRQRSVNVGGVGQSMRVIARIMRAHGAELDFMTAAGAPQRANAGGIAVPFVRLRFEPANAIVRVLHRGRVGRLWRAAQVDGDD